MNKFNLPKIIEDTKASMVKHSPEIALGAGIAFGVTTVVLAVKSTPKALMLLEERKLDLKTEELPKVEVIKTAGPCYIPAFVTGSLSIMCLIGGNTVQARRNAALTTAYTLTTATLKEYRNKVVETIGEKKETVVRDAIAKDKVEQQPIENKTVVITGNGDTLCFEPLCGHYFRSNIDKIKRSLNDLNSDLLNDGYISLNDFYYAVDLDDTKLGSILGWRYESGLIDINFSAQVSTSGEPCLVINFNHAPEYDFEHCL